MKIEKHATKHMRHFGIVGQSLLLALVLVLLCQSDLAFADVIFTEGVDIGSTGNIIIVWDRCKFGSNLTTGASSFDSKIPGILIDENIRSIEDYTQWLGENIRYQSDGDMDTWSSPEETLTRKYGDCEDFAFLSEAVLRVLGYQPRVMAYTKGKEEEGHAICAFKKGDHYLYFDNAELKKTYATSMEQFARHIDSKDSPAILNAENIDGVFQKAVNLEGITRGAKFEEKDGVMRIIADEDTSLNTDVQFTQIEIRYQK